MELATASYTRHTHAVLTALLSKDFVDEEVFMKCYKVFPGDLKTLIKSFEKAHSLTENDITLDEVWEVYNTYYHSTTARKEVVRTLLDQLSSLKETDEGVAAGILSVLYEKEQLVYIAQKVQEGLLDPEGKLEEIKEYINTLTMPKEEDDFLDTATHEEILEKLHYKGEFEFSNGLDMLQNVVNGVDKGMHMIVFSSSNAGKSTFVAQLGVGFMQQNAKILYVANEEPPFKIRINFIRSASGSTEDELKEQGELPNSWTAIDDNFLLLPAHGMTMRQIEKRIETLQPDIVIFDQVDNILPGGIKEDRRDLILDTMYQRVRMWAAQHNFVAISVTQATKEAVGRFDTLRQDMMKDANISKPASADLIIGIGMKDMQTSTRCFNLCKNKITGIHEPIYCDLDYTRARYTE